MHTGVNAKLYEDEARGGDTVQRRAGCAQLAIGPRLGAAQSANPQATVRPCVRGKTGPADLAQVRTHGAIARAPCTGHPGLAQASNHGR